MFEIKYLILIIIGIGFIDLIRDMKSLVPNLKAPSLEDDEFQNDALHKAK